MNEKKYHCPFCGNKLPQEAIQCLEKKCIEASIYAEKINSQYTKISTVALIIGFSLVVIICMLITIISGIFWEAKLDGTYIVIIIAIISVFLIICFSFAFERRTIIFISRDKIKVDSGDKIK